MRRPPRLAEALFALAFIARSASFAFGDTKVEAGPCSITTGGSASNNTVTCNLGLAREQLKETIDAAVKGATDPLVDRITGIGKVLGVTEEGAKTVLKAVGKDPNVPDDKLGEALIQAAKEYNRLQAEVLAVLSVGFGVNEKATRALFKVIEDNPNIPDNKLGEVLIKITTDYKRLQAQVATLDTEDPTARKLIEQARVAITVGDFARADELLGEATKAQIGAAEEARKLAEQAREAEDAKHIDCASPTKGTATRSSINCGPPTASPAAKP